MNLATHVNGALDVVPLSCTSCHGSTQNAAPPVGTNGETLTTALAVGAHQQHLSGGALSNPIACAECHVPPTSMDHADGAAQLTFGTLATTGGAVPAWDPVTATCSSSYCHGQFVGGDLLNAPSWTTVNGTQAACGTCHGAPPPAPHTASTACGSCHAGYTQTSVNLATHVNGIVEAAASPHAAGWADPAQHGKQVNLTGLAGCKSCHGDLGATTSCGTCHAAAGFATWDTSCTFCHGSTSTGRQNPPLDIQGRTVATNVSVGVHEAHATTTIATAVACVQCHPARTASVSDRRCAHRRERHRRGRLRDAREDRRRECDLHTHERDERDLRVDLLPRPLLGRRELGLRRDRELDEHDAGRPARPATAIRPRAAGTRSTPGRASSATSATTPW